MEIISNTESHKLKQILIKQGFFYLIQALLIFGMSPLLTSRIDHSNYLIYNNFILPVFNIMPIILIIAIPFTVLADYFRWRVVRNLFKVFLRWVYYLIISIMTFFVPILLILAFLMMIFPH